MGTLRLVAHLRQLFWLLTPLRHGAVEYKRVATDRLIIVRLQEDADLSLVLGSVRTRDALYPSSFAMSYRIIPGM